jgi:fumarate hydratase class II
MMATSLAPVIGYDAAAKLAKDAFAQGKTIRELATERGLLKPAELKRLLDPDRMTRPTKD